RTTRESNPTETRVGSGNLDLRQAQRMPNNVGAAHDRNHLVESVDAAHALPAEAAVRAQNQPLRRDVLQRLANQRRNVRWHLHLQRPVADDTDADLLVSADRRGDLRDLRSVVVRRLEGYDVNIETIEVRQCGFVRVARLDALRQRIAPAGMAPHLGLSAQPAYLEIERLDV